MLDFISDSDDDEDLSVSVGASHEAVMRALQSTLQQRHSCCAHSSLSPSEEGLLELEVLCLFPQRDTRVGRVAVSFSIKSPLPLLVTDTTALHVASCGFIVDCNDRKQTTNKMFV